MRKSITTVAAAIAASTALAGAPSHASAATTLRPAQLLGFNWIQGQLQWKASNRSRLRRSAFVFDDNGAFAMFQPDGYPTLSGAWQNRGRKTLFHGVYEFNTLGGSTIAEVQGFVKRNGVLKLVYSSGQSLAAVLNCQEHGACTTYGSSRTKAYVAAVRVVRS